MNKEVIKKFKKIFIILTFIFIVYVIFSMYYLSQFFKRNPIVPTVETYPFVIKAYYNQYGDKISFFPTKIDNINDFYCIFEDNFDGYNIHHLKFLADKKYIEDTIEKNKKDVYKKFKLSEIGDYYNFIDNNFNIKDKNSAIVYILKNKNNDKDYTSGIIITKLNEIIFFYANYNLKK